MPRTTLNIDASVLRELKRRQRRENKNLGQLVSELLARSLSGAESAGQVDRLEWHTAAMGARVDLDDEEAVRRALDAR